MATPGNFGGGSTGPDQGFLVARVFPIGPGGPQSGFSALRYVPSTKGLSQKKIGSADSPPPPGALPDLALVLGPVACRFLLLAGYEDLAAPLFALSR
jgi:hypothetical protein